MDAFERAYAGVKNFIEDFANSSSALRPIHQENAPAEYAKYNDGSLNDMLGNPLTRMCLRAIADKYFKETMEKVQEEATVLSLESYPALFSAFENCCTVLGIYDRPTVYVTSMLRGINALSIEYNHKTYILISRFLPVFLSKEEQAFVIGHELGHQQQGNLLGHTVNGLLDNAVKASELFGPIMADILEVPLKDWCRQSEFNADRAGYLCCRDINVIRNLFAKVMPAGEPTAYDLYKELSAAHPLPSTRFAALEEYLRKN